MENCGGRSLYSIFADRNASEPIAKRYIKQAVRGLIALHSAGIYQVDVKATNMAVNEQGVLKLLDFGLSTTVNKISYRIKGADGYYSREMALEIGYLPELTDSWNIGICTYKILYGFYPFGKEVGGLLLV